jgi:hypothetical protein
VLIEVPDTRLIHLRPLVPRIREAIDNVRPGQILVVTRD